jgi:hypothetical protein
MPPVRMVGARGCACHEYREWLDRGIRSIACMPIYVAKPLYRIPQRGFGRDVFGDLCSRFLARRYNWPHHRGAWTYRCRISRCLS